MNSDDLTKEIHSGIHDDSKTKSIKCTAVVLFIRALLKLPEMNLTQEQTTILHQIKDTYLNEFQEGNKNELN
jgi:hypothetical protein